MQAVTKHMDKREEIKMELQEKQIQIGYKIYMEAEDIGQSRIHACTAFLKNTEGIRRQRR